MKRKGILVATAVAMCVMAASALGAVIGSAGSVTYATVTAPLAPSEEVQIQTNCTDDKSITGVVFGGNSLGLSPKALRMTSATAAVIYVRSTANDTLTSYVMCTSAKVKYETKTETHVALLAGKTKVKCPANKHVLGGGVDAGNRFITTTHPFDSRDKGKLPDDGWKASTIGSNSGSVDVTVACSKTMPKYSKESLTLTPSAGSAVIPKCKKGTHLISGGAQFSGATVYGDLRSMRPRDGDDADTVPDDDILINMGNDGSNPDAAKLTGYAICID